VLCGIPVERTIWMKILVLAPPMGSAGGIQRYTTTLVRSLRNVMGETNIHFVAVSAEPLLRDDGKLALTLGTKIRFFVATVMQALFWRPQLIICAHIGVAPAARIIHRFFGFPYWVVLYGIEVWGELPKEKELALSESRRLISISQFTFQTASARHQLSEMEFGILPPAFEIDEVQKKAAPPLDAENTPPIVLTVGRLAASEQYKGHDVMLNSWAMVRNRIPDALYVIVGQGDDRARLEARARELKIEESVRFTGAVSASELQNWYHRCRVFAMPARTELDLRPPRGEGFGIVFLEAMAHGKPVLGPRNGAPSEFIRSGEHGLLVDPTDSTEVANALVELLIDKDRADRMGQAAKTWVIQEFSEERFRERLKKILENDPGSIEKNH
jgi:glycosyltransferase involved in cell wall biosynthesis